MNELQELSKQYQAPDGARIFYKLITRPDSNYTLVMLHGMASNHTRWTEFISYSRLIQSMNFLRLDLRGHANSMVFGHRIGHGIWKRDLHEILNQESLNRVILLGHSMGAQLALHYALTYPEQVMGVVLIDPTLPGELKGQLSLARRLHYPLWIAIQLLRLLTKINPLKKAYSVCDLHELDIKTRKLMTSQSVDVLVELYSSPKEDLKFLPFVNYLQDVYAVTSALPDISAIRCPIHLLLSRASSIVKPENVVKYFPVQNPPEVTYIDANHWPLTEKPDDIRDAIDTWCRKLITAEQNKNSSV